MKIMKEKILKQYIDLDKMSRKEMNFKSRLIAWCKTNKMQVSFELIDQVMDKDHSPTFSTEVHIEGIPAGNGRGYSKKESQQKAAQMALKVIRNDETFREQIEIARERNRSQQAEADRQAAEAERHAEEAERQVEEAETNIAITCTSSVASEEAFVADERIANE